MMDDFDLPPLTDDEKRQFAETSERAHAAGEISDRDFARARIQGAMACWHLAAYEAAGKPEKVPDSIYDDLRGIERVGIPAIDDALPYLQSPVAWPEGMPLMRDNPDRWRIAAILSFLSGMEYMLRERSDALELSESRKKAAHEAVQHALKAAALLDGIDNQLLAHEFRKLATLSTDAQYGRVSPRSGLMPDAWTGQFTSKRGGKSRDANIIKAIARHFPDSQEFLSASNGYSIIARLAVLCGLEKPSAAAYVRSVLESNKKAAKKETASPRRGNSIAALLTGNKPA